MPSPEEIACAMVALGAAPTLAVLAKRLGCAASELRDDLAPLLELGLVELWNVAGLALRVAPAPILAARLGMALDGRSRYWRAVDRRKEDVERQRSQRFRNGERFVEMPREPGRASRPSGEPFWGTRPPYDPSEMPWPTRLISGGAIWPVPGQNRGPYGQYMAPEEDPRLELPPPPVTDIPGHVDNRAPRSRVRPPLIGDVCPACRTEDGEGLHKTLEYCLCCDRPGHGAAIANTRKAETPERAALAGGTGAVVRSENVESARTSA